jgi:hypothetical protein
MILPVFDGRGFQMRKDEAIAELRASPGKNLRTALEYLGLDFADFAIEAGMAKGGDPNTLHIRARTVIRRYTHPAPGGRPKWPGPEMDIEWALILCIDPGYFYMDPARARRSQELRRARAALQDKAA